MSKLSSSLIALMLMVVMGCVSMPKLYADSFVKYDRMDFRSYVSSRILPLEGLGGNLSSYQNASIMKNGFLTSGSESYGYFTVKLSFHYDWRGGSNDKQTETTWLIAGGLTLIGLFLLPMFQSRNTLTVVIEFFDCNKNSIASYKSSTAFDAYDNSLGIDTDRTLKAEPLYRGLIKQCLTDAARDADKINADLINAKYPPPPPAPPIETVAKDAFDNLSGKIPSDAIIAVIGANQNADVTLGTRQIEQQFVNSGNFHVVDRISVNVLLAEIIFSRSVFVSEAIEAGRMLSATHIVYVEIVGEGANKELNFRVLSVGTGEVIVSFSSSFQT